MRSLLLATLVTFTPVAAASAQVAVPKDAVEQEIRRLELRDAEAVLHGDLAAMEKSWSADFAVNSPRNQLTKGREEVLRLIRSNMIGTYAAFERDIETVMIHGDAAIVFGLETVTPTSATSQAGQVVRRRYMNVWTKQESGWLLTARHVSVVTPS